MSKKKRKIGLDDFLKDQGAGGIDGLETMKPEFRPEFRLDETKGVYFLPGDKGGVPQDPQWICSPLKVLALTRDEQSVGWGYVLAFTDRDHKTKSWTLAAELLAGDGLEMRKILMSMGLRITPNFILRQKLAAYIQFSDPKDKRRAICTDRTGWHDEKVFVLPDQTLGEQTGEVVLFQSAAGESLSPFSERGTTEEWRKEVAGRCTGNSRLLFAVSSSFAAPLLNLTNTRNGGFHYLGGTSTGKSTGLEVGASVYGNPCIYKQTWRATDNGLEGVAATYNDVMLPLDELAEIDPRKAGEVAYMLANGQGKSRANKNGAARNRKSWRLLFLSSGEVSLADHMKTAGMTVKAGQEIRLVDIPSDAGVGMGMFQDIHGAESASRFADELRRVLVDYHGAAGIAYLRKIVADQTRLPGS